LGEVYFSSKGILVLFLREEWDFWGRKLIPKQVFILSTENKRRFRENKVKLTANKLATISIGRVNEPNIRLERQIGLKIPP